MQPLILHAHATGPNPFKIAILLQSLQVPYAVHLWQVSDDPARGLKGAKFLSINGNGRVPALEDPNTGVVSWESLAIANYVIRMYDKEGRLGPGSAAGASAWSEQEIVDYEKWIALLVSTLGPFQGQVNWFKHYSPTHNPEAIQRYEEQTYRCWDLLEAQLKKSGSGFVLPRGFTAVDVHFYPWIRGYKFSGLSMQGYPVIKEWYERVQAMEVVRDAYESVGKGAEM